MAIIITGAGSGIGAGLAVSYLEDGFDVLLADLDEAAATEVADAAAGLPGTAVPVACDVREPDDVRATVDLALTRFGSITAMVNNAGISVAGHSHAMELAHWERAVDVNLRGVIHGVHAVLPTWSTPAGVRSSMWPHWQASSQRPRSPPIRPRKLRWSP